MWPFTARKKTPAPSPPSSHTQNPDTNEAEVYTKEGKAVANSVPGWTGGGWTDILPYIEGATSPLVSRYISVESQINAYYIGRYDGLSLHSQRGAIIALTFVPKQQTMISHIHKHVAENARNAIEGHYIQGYMDAMIILSHGIDPIHPHIRIRKPRDYQDPEFSQHEWMQRKRIYSPIR